MYSGCDGLQRQLFSSGDVDRTFEDSFWTDVTSVKRMKAVVGIVSLSSVCFRSAGCLSLMMMSAGPPLHVHNSWSELRDSRSSEDVRSSDQLPE